MSSESPVMKYVEAMVVTGLRIRTKNSDEFDEKTAKLSHLWQEFHASGLASDAAVFGVYSEYESDANGLYTVTAGVKSAAPMAGFSAVTIEAGNYLVFEGQGVMPVTVIETWKRVWDYFAEANKPARKFISDFEVYNGADKVAVYIGV